LCSVDELHAFGSDIVRQLGDKDFVRSMADDERRLLNCAIYTIQQSIGIALDGLPASQTNTARKLNGDLFERLIQLCFAALGVSCRSATIKVPIEVDGAKQFDMNFQHDLIISHIDDVKLIGSVKTSSKDRIGKIFVDKMLLNSLTGKEVPHIAIFLNDVQRGKKTDKSYKVSSTFLPGHFKAYTIKINPLDGVYYCDRRPNMLTDPILSAGISTLDRLFCEDVWRFLDTAENLSATID
jgi:hypothetical protein